MTSSGGNLNPWRGTRKNFFSYTDSPTFGESLQIRNKNNCPIYVNIKAKDDNVNVTEKNLLIAYREIEHAGGKIQKSRTTKEGGFTVLLGSNGAATSLINNLKKVNGIDVVVERNNMLNNSKGVIYGRKFKDMNEQELLEGFRYFEPTITDVKHLERKNDSGTNVKTGQILVIFNTATPPRSVNILSEVFEVRRWYPAPLKCRNCLRFRHHESNCKGKKICKRCAGELLNKEQHACTQIFCVNCESTSHATSDSSCPEFEKEKEIVCLAMDKNLSRYQARRQWHNEHPQYIPPKLWTAAAANT